MPHIIISQPHWDGRLEFMSAVKAVVKRLNKGDDTLTAKELLEGFQSAAREIRAKVPQAQGEMFAQEDDDLEYFVTELEAWTPEFVESHPDICGAFDSLMDRLYDWCDVNRWRVEPAR